MRLIEITVRHGPTPGLPVQRNEKMLSRISVATTCWLAVVFIASGQPSVLGQQSATDSKEPASQRTPEQAAKLKERDALATRGNSLQKEGKLTEAIDIGKQVLSIEREFLGAQHAE